MFDEKEIEELCDEFLNLDGNMFLESAEDVGKFGGDIVSNGLHGERSPHLNNNFICYPTGVDLGKSDTRSTQLDVLNENSIHLTTFERFKNSENTGTAAELGKSLENSVRPAMFLDKKENEIDNEFKEVDEKLTSPDASVGKNFFHRNGWGPDGLGLWRSGPSSLNLDQPCNNYSLHQDLTSSVTYNSNEQHSLNTFLSSPKRIYSHQQLGAKVEMVYSLLSMLDTNNREDMSKTFLAMSSSPESCHAMRQSGCLPLLIQLIHSSELNREVRERAAEALHNIVHSQTDEKRRKREVRVLKLLQQVREYCDELKNSHPQELVQASEKHPINAIGTLMKFSFDAEHRQAICILGGLHAISELIQVDYEAHGNTTGESPCVTLRRYAGMSLTNLTFGDCKNKALLCSFNKFMYALVDQLKSPCEDLRQVTASVIRNLSWRADSESKQALRDVGAVTALTVSAMEGKKESTLKSILSALWNLSAHCSLNKVDICSVPGALAFLVKMLRYKSSSNTLAIVENAGGILRNVSSHVAVREDYRQILRDNNCFEVLLEQLKSPSLTIVSNACGTLWNLSARCPEDQRRLWEMGATTMLRSLVQSKHKMISMGSSAALKNLLAANPNENLLTHLDSTAKSLGLQNLPTLFVRKKKALEQELNITLTETCENIDSIVSPTYDSSKTEEAKKGNGPRRSESRDSVQSTQSDSTYERLNQISLKNEEKPPPNKSVALHESLDEKSMPRKVEEQKLMRRYKTSMIPTPTFKKVNQDRINEKTREVDALENKSTSQTAKSDLKEDATSRPKSLKTPCSDAQFFAPKEDCAVGKNDSETLEDIETPKVAVLKSSDAPVASSHSNRGRNTSRRKSNSSTTDDGKKCERIEEIRDGNENYESSESYLASVLNGEKNGSSSQEKFSSSVETGYVSEEFDGVNKGEMAAACDQLSNNDSLSSSKGRGKSPQRIRNIKTKEIASGVAKFEESQPKDLPLKVDFSSKSDVSAERLRNIDEAICGESSQVNPVIKNTFVETKRMEGHQSGFLNQVHLPQTGQNEYYETSLESNKTSVEKNRYQSSGGEAKPSLVKSLSHSNQSSSQPTLANFDNGNIQKVGHDVVDPPQIQPVEPYACYNKLANIRAKVQPTEIGCPSDSAEWVPGETETADVGNIDGVQGKASNTLVLPKFKVGSPITDSKALHLEANKICREIRKHQDFEMGCSMTSEVSLVSCSSFIDMGDYSLFESSTDPLDFDDPENLDLGKVSYKLKNHPLRKPVTSQTAESVSLPSLGSLKNEQIEALDLDNSILSVASITSEIAETYSNDFDGFRTYTKTYKVDSRTNEPPEDTLADATLVSNGDDTLNADSENQNNPEFFDDDNSLHSQENLPLDPEGFEEAPSDRVRKKLTPKEKRKTFHDRYRTYTIRDSIKTPEKAGGCQGVNDAADVVSVNYMPHNNRNEFDYSNRVHNVDDVGSAVGNRKIESSPGSFFDGRNHESFLTSKPLTDTDYLIPGLIGVCPKTVQELTNIGPAERKELVDNAKLVAFSLKTAVFSEMTSDSDTEEPHIEFDTATYSKHHRDRTGFSSQEQQYLQHYEMAPGEEEGQEEDEEEEEEEEEEEIRGARILKPDEKPEEVPKGIRGRRKPLYSSPQKHRLRTNGSPSNSPKAVDPRKSLPEAPRLHREGTFTKDEGFAVKKNEAKIPRTIPVLYRNVESKNPSSGRAASGKAGGVPAATPKAQVSRIGRPLSTYATKAGERRPESDTSQRRSFSAEGEPGDSSTVTRRPASTGLTSPKMRNSSSNQNVRAGGGYPVKTKNQTMKSQSDASLNSVTGKDKGKQKTPKKEVTSKIASLWKKVEESKQRSKTAKDSRVWISGDKSAGTGDEVLVVEEILDIPTRRIVHSLTCQGIADEASGDGASRERTSRSVKEFTQFGGSKEKIERRKIVSAVVPPYNYKPPVPDKTPTPSKTKQADPFSSKASLKVTTV